MPLRKAVFMSRWSTFTLSHRYAIAFVSDGEQSANSGRIRHWRVHIVRVKVETFGLTETEDAAACLEFVNAAIAADFDLEHQLSWNDR